MELFADINWVAVVVATVAAFLAGWLWYGPIFGKPWMKLMSMTEKDLTGAGKSMAQGFANTFVAMTMMAVLLGMFGPTDLMGALQLGFVGWIGFTLYSELGGVIWGNGNYPFNLMLINAGHQLMTALLGMAVLMYMG